MSLLRMSFGEDAVEAIGKMSHFIRVQAQSLFIMLLLQLLQRGIGCDNSIAAS